MIIGIDISSIPYGTGVSEYTKQLVIHLLQQDKVNTYKLFFGSLRSKLPADFQSEIKKHKNCKLYNYPLPPKILSIIWNQLNLLPIELLIGKCDVFHTSDWTQPPTLKSKTVSTIHDLTPFINPQWHTSIVIKTHSQKINKAIKSDCKFISVSKSTQKDFKNLFNKDSTLIYEACDKYYFPVSRPTKDYFLAQGTQEPRKNLQNILFAWKDFSKKHPKIKLKIAGKYGWGQQISELKNVEILGYVTEKELLTLHQNAIALIYPSLYEGFGLPILKSLKCNVPVITSNLSSLPEVCGKAGVLVNPQKPSEIHSAMQKMLDKDFYSTLVLACKSQSEKFSWIDTANQTLNVYQHAFKV